MKRRIKMKNLRLVLPIFLLILLVLLFTGCKGVIPSPGATEEDVTTISGQIKMPLICCDTLSEIAESVSRENTCDESELWNPTAGAIVELRSAKKGKCKKLIADTTADDNGYYLFEDVQPGVYIITAKCPVEGNEGFLLKDVAEKVSGVALDAGTPDCTSTALALVIEKINNCYNDWYQCFGELTAPKIYNKVEEIAEDIGTVDIPAIKAHADFGNYCDSEDEDLVDLICAWSCCIGPGATGGSNGGGDSCDNNNEPYDVVLDYQIATVGKLYTGAVSATDPEGDALTFGFKDGYEPPGDMEIDSETGVLTWTPTCADICSCNNNSVDVEFEVELKNGLTRVLLDPCDLVKITVDDGCNQVDAELCIEVINNPPVIDDNTVPNTSGGALEIPVKCCIDPIDINATDPDDCGQTIKYSLDTASEARGMSIDGDGVINWCADDCSYVGNTYTVTITAEDDCGAKDTASFDVKVINNAPTIDSVNIFGENWKEFCSNTHKICVSENTLVIEIRYSDADDCQTLSHSLEPYNPSTQLPPSQFVIVEQSNGIDIIFNANCYDVCIPCQINDIENSRGFCCGEECSWYFKFVVSDGCESVERKFKVMVDTDGWIGL